MCANNQAPTLSDLGGSMENLPAGQAKLCACEGDCDNDSDCAPGLKCYQRDSSSDVPPGCQAGGSGDLGTHDYCYDPSATPVGPCGNNQAPTLVNLGGSMENMPAGQTKLCACEGDCDNDSDCAPGLVCFQRDSSSDVPPGCQAGGAGDDGTTDYCANPAAATPCANNQAPTLVNLG